MSQETKVGLTLIVIYIVVAIIGIGLERWRPMEQEKDND